MEYEHRVITDCPEQEINIYEYPLNFKDIYELYENVKKILFKIFTKNMHQRNQKIRGLLIPKDFRIDEYRRGMWYVHYKCDLEYDIIDRYSLTINLYQGEVIFITCKKFSFSEFSDENGDVKINVKENSILHKFYIRHGIHRPWVIKERVCIHRGKKANKKNKYQNRYVSLKNVVKPANLEMGIFRYYMIALHNQISLQLLMKIRKIKFSREENDRIEMPSNKTLFKAKNISEIVERKIGHKIPINLVYQWYDIIDMPIDIVAKCFKKDDYSLVYQNLMNYKNVFRIPSNSYRFLITDTLNMSYLLGEKVSPRLQSLKKLTQIHNDLSKRHRLLSMPDVKVHKAYYQLSIEWLELIDTKKRLLEEGLEQRNCVTSYIHRINNGECAIFSTMYEEKRYTIEIVKSVNFKGNYIFKCVQVKGLQNSSPPDKLSTKIYITLNKYNKKVSQNTNIRGD